MGKGEEEIADRTLSVSNYFYCPKSPFLVQSGLLGSCKKSSPSHSSPRDISRSLSCCGAKARCIQVSSIHLWCDQQRNLLEFACHLCTRGHANLLCIVIATFSTPTLPVGSVPTTAFLLTVCSQDLPGAAGQHACSSAAVSLGAGSLWNSSDLSVTTLLPLLPLWFLSERVCVCVYLFAQLVLCSEYWQTVQTQQLCSPTVSQCVMRAWPFNGTLSCKFILPPPTPHLSINTMDEKCTYTKTQQN